MNTKQTIYIDNMVCSRCKLAVHQLATNLGWRVEAIELGHFTGWPPGSLAQDIPKLARQLSSVGFRVHDGTRGAVSRIKGLIIDLIHDDTADSSPPLSELIATNLGQSYSHLSYLFSKEVGCTIGDFYHIHRIERAKQLLVNTDEQISSIAYRLHYGSLGRFTAAFRKSTGLPPSAFRKRGIHGQVPFDEL